MDAKIIGLTVESISACLAVVLSTLVLYGFWKLITAALPGDREMLATLKRVKARKAQTDQQSRQTIAEIAGLAAQTHRIRRSEERKDEPAGYGEGTETHRAPYHMAKQIKKI